MLELGMPDVNYCIDGEEGWIELKSVDNWPKRPDTPIRLPHYTVEQRAWQRQRGEAGGKVFILLRVEREYMLFDWPWAIRRLGMANKEDLIKNAIVYSKGKFPTKDLVAALRAL